MKKQVKNCALAAITVMSAASMAHAVDINIYGASAEFNYWNNNAYDFVKNQAKCSVIPVTTPVTAGQSIVDTLLGHAVTQTAKHGFIAGTSCQGSYAATGLNFRFSGIASAEGFLSVTKQAPLFVPDVASNGIVGSCSVAKGERIMMKDSTGALGCEAVNIGTTDLSIENINQTADMITLPAYTVPTGYDTATTIVTPFAFYVNNNVTAKQCFDSTGNNLGVTCSTATDCNYTNYNGTAATGNTCKSAILDNLSRAQVVQLFQGNVANWTDLGANFNTNPVTVCLRVPGSGTHATLDKTVMSAGDLGWGAPGSTEFPPSNPSVSGGTSGGAPYVIYNEATGDMQNCLATAGAVGYMDGDNGTTGSYTKVKYNGVAASRENIRRGDYDFYAVGHIYYDSSKTGVFNGTSVVADITSETNSVGAFNSLSSGRSQFYAAQSEMKYLRLSDDGFPVQQF